MKQKTRKTLKKVLSASLIPLAANLTINNSNAQTENPNNLNTLHFILQPEDLGWGLRNDYRIPSKEKDNFGLSRFGIYTSMSAGKYILDPPDLRKKHIKFGVGGIFYPRKNSLKNLYEFISLGGAYNYYSKLPYLEEYRYGRMLHPFSTEIGIGLRANNFSGFISFDISNAEYTFGAGLVYDWLDKKQIKKNKRLLAQINP
ncbi:MAG: hypothetical protein ACP5NZ_02720 [Nanobdellota archaeon]